MMMLQAIGQALQDRGIRATGQGCLISSEQSASSRAIILTTLMVEEEDDHQYAREVRKPLSWRHW